MVKGILNIIINIEKIHKTISISILGMFDIIKIF